MRKKVLLCTEFSELATGYGVYAKNLLNRLKDKYDVAELACYVSQNDSRLNNVPWTIFPNKPLENTKEMQAYLSSPTFEYGEYRFNEVLISFKPDYVLDFRDPWAFEFQSRSPFREYYNWVISPTIDAAPQNAEWVDLYSEADGILTYSKFGMDLLKNEYGLNNLKTVASPAASQDFKPLSLEERKNIRSSIGISDDMFVIGSVMRNQPRKLFPDLLKSFQIFLQSHPKAYLYLHTCFPDVGWNIPELLIESGLSSRVLFTYKCKNCDNIEVCRFSDSLRFCNKCNNFTSSIAGIGNPLNDQELNLVYNLFDCYVQYATNEGFGIPVVEASQAGIPAIVIDYSSMEDFKSTVGAIPLEPMAYTKESSTSRLMAVPSESNLIDVLNDFYSLKTIDRNKLYEIGLMSNELSKKEYNWDKNAKAWIDAIESTPTKNKNWLSRPDIKQPDPPIENHFYSPEDQATYLITNVLKKPELMYRQLWRRLVKDLTYKTRLKSVSSGPYFREDAVKDHLKHENFNFTSAYSEMVELRNYYNFWEKNRYENSLYQ